MCTATETRSANQLTYENNHSLSTDTYDSKSNENKVETNPTNEGFIILSDNQKQHSSTTSANRIRNKQTSSARTSTNITAVTPRKTTAKSSGRSSNRTSTSRLDYSPTRRGRRLLNDISYDTDLETTPANKLFDPLGDVESFLAVNDEELSKQLMLLSVTMEGSTFSMYPPNLGLRNLFFFFSFSDRRYYGRNFW